MTNYTFSGSFLAGKDDLGTFATPGDLTGKPYSLTFTFDDVKGSPNLNVPFTYNLNGDDADVPVTALLKIGGTDFAFEKLGAEVGYFGSSAPFAETDFGSSGSYYAFTFDTWNGNSTSEDQIGFGRRLGENDAFSRFSINRGGTYTWGEFGAPSVPKISSIPSGVNPGVPEPTSWAMMVAGFGLIGTVMRRRRLPSLKTA